MSSIASNVIAIDTAQTCSDEVLLAGIAGRDGPGENPRSRSAMHAFYGRHHLRVYRFVLRILRDANLADDIVSQVFLDVWRTAEKFRGGSQVSTWLLSIARFKALTALRQRRHEDIDRDEMREIPDGAPTPEAALERSHTSAVLRRCIGRLSPAHREIIDLVYYHEKSVEEAGRILGIPQSTVKTRMFYARKQLAELLKRAGIDSLAA